MPDFTAALHAVTPDERLFGRLGEGFVFCVPADRERAVVLLDRLRILGAGPWEGYLRGRRIFWGVSGALGLDAIFWQLGNTDIKRVERAGLIDRQRYVEIGC